MHKANALVETSPASGLIRQWVLRHFKNPFCSVDELIASVAAKFNIMPTDVLDMRNYICAQYQAQPATLLVHMQLLCPDMARDVTGGSVMEAMKFWPQQNVHAARPMPEQSSTAKQNGNPTLQQSTNTSSTGHTVSSPTALKVSDPKEWILHHLPNPFLAPAGTSASFRQDVRKLCDMYRQNPSMLQLAVNERFRNKFHSFTEVQQIIAAWPDAATLALMTIQRWIVQNLQCPTTVSLLNDKEFLTSFTTDFGLPVHDATQLLNSTIQAFRASPALLVKCVSDHASIERFTVDDAVATMQQWSQDAGAVATLQPATSAPPVMSPPAIVSPPASSDPGNNVSAMLLAAIQADPSLMLALADKPDIAAALLQLVEPGGASIEGHGRFRVVGPVMPTGDVFSFHVPDISNVPRNVITAVQRWFVVNYCKPSGSRFHEFWQQCYREGLPIEPLRQVFHHYLFVYGFSPETFYADFRVIAPESSVTLEILQEAVQRWPWVSGKAKFMDDIEKAAGKVPRKPPEMRSKRKADEATL